MKDTKEKLNSDQAKWLYKIRENTNFYDSLSVYEQELVYTILKEREYSTTSISEINAVRKYWIRYIKLQNNRTI